MPGGKTGYRGNIPQIHIGGIGVNAVMHRHIGLTAAGPEGIHTAVLQRGRKRISVGDGDQRIFRGCRRFCGMQHVIIRICRRFILILDDIAIVHARRKFVIQGGHILGQVKGQIRHARHIAAG